MYFSKHNIFSGVKNSDNYYIVNPLTGHADILSPTEAKDIKQGRFDILEQSGENAYLIDKEKEDKLFREKYLDFIDNRESDELQLFFVPTYACNFACSYCYQKGYQNAPQVLSKELTDAYFSFINKHFATRKKYVTLFGGEPLLPGKKYRELIQYFADHVAENNLELAVVTNGYLLEEYLPVFSRTNIREIQVTLDGTQQMHDCRRPMHTGEGTFDKIVRGIDLCLESNLPVNLRMVIDKENIDELPHLADFAIKKGWADNSLFKTQLGRNYELHDCQAKKSHLFSRLELYNEIYELIKKNPQILEFHKPAFSIAKFLWEEGEMPDPLFDSCPATKTEWAFDYTGRIYGCTATVGKAGEELGTFFPGIDIDEEKISEWEERDVLSIKECNSCNVQLACGGGCGSVARNQNGSVTSPDCRPVKELLEAGLSLYFEEMHKITIKNERNYSK